MPKAKPHDRVRLNTPFADLLDGREGEVQQVERRGGFNIYYVLLDGDYSQVGPLWEDEITLTGT